MVMKAESRMSKSIKNAKVALFFYFINLILQFFSRKFFLDYLGAEVLGLNTTAQNLLGFLNLAELGIGSAVSYTLYKPLFQRNTREINEIVSIQGWMYRKIACVVIAGACVLMFFFPIIFRKAELPLWYAYGSFVVLLTSSLLSYFINYRQIVLTADQQEYKITINIQGFKIVKVILQILAIRFFNNGYLYWLALEFVMAFVTTFVLERVLKQEYPWLQSTPSVGKVLREKYPEIITKTKQVFFHKIAGFTLSQTSPIIIYAYSSLTLVAIYGNYMLIVNGVVLLMVALLNGINAGVGNLVAGGNKEMIKKVFWELTSLRVWIASIICFVIYKQTHSFISLWVGDTYHLDGNAFFVLIVYTFISLTRTNDSFLAAYGLFQDIWAPVTEAILNIGCSILLGYFWGLTGILSGVVISLLVIVCIWKPYFLYKKGFQENVSEYIIMCLKYGGVIFLSCLISFFLLKYLSIESGISSYINWLWLTIEIVSIYSFFSFFLFFIFDKGIRDFVSRVRQLIH